MTTLNRLQLEKIIREEVEIFVQEGILDSVSSGAKIKKAGADIDPSEPEKFDPRLDPGAQTPTKAGEIFLTDLINNRLVGAGLDPGGEYFRAISGVITQFYQNYLEKAGVNIKITEVYRFPAGAQQELFRHLVSIPRTGGEKAPQGVLRALVDDVTKQLNANAKFFDEADPPEGGGVAGQEEVRADEEGPGGPTSRADLIKDPRLIAGIILTAMSMTPGLGNIANKEIGKIFNLLKNEPKFVRDLDLRIKLMINKAIRGDASSGAYSFGYSKQPEDVKGRYGERTSRPLPEVRRRAVGESIKISKSGFKEAMKILFKHNELSSNK
tara:strand:- start:238 stop:1212 length:975 start_codon:yes stop_codon:yes gene_type:complete